MKRVKKALRILGELYAQADMCFVQGTMSPRRFRQDWRQLELRLRCMGLVEHDRNLNKMKKKGP